VSRRLEPVAAPTFIALFLRFGEAKGMRRGLRGARVEARRGRGRCLILTVAGGTAKMIFLGFGKFARSDRIYALEPLPEGQRGHGSRTRVWVEGIPDPIVASRTERAIIAAMGDDAGAEASRILDGALDLAQRVAEAAEQGRFDVVDLGRRARRLLQPAAAASRPESLF